jgi:NRPS condensation-like uncharacterized protein
MNLETNYSVTPFEHHMMADDTERFPTNTIWRFNFSGLLEVEKFENSVREALKRHPLLRSKLSNSPQSRLGELKWQPQGLDKIPMHWCDDDLHKTMGAVQAINLTDEMSFRLYAHQYDNKHVLTLQTAHAATDGQGVLSFMGDVLCIYAKAPLQEQKDTDLTVRIHFHLKLKERLKLLPKQLFRLVTALKRRAVPLWSPGLADDSPMKIPFRGAARIELDEDQLLTVKKTAKSFGVSVNDWLLNVLFKSMKNWNEKGGQGYRGIRIAMPTNLRRHLQMPAANVVSMCFMHRNANEIESPNLLASLTKETGQIKSHRLGMTLIMVLSLVSKLRRGRAFNTGSEKKCHSSLVLTNLGRILSSVELPRTSEGCLILDGNLSLSSLEVYTLVRPTTYLSFAILTYGGKMSINLAYNREVMNIEHADLILKEFKELLLVAGAQE